MFCYQCEETVNGTGCTKMGVCGKTPEVADIQDQLIYLLKLIAKKSEPSKKVDIFIMESLFATITNANFDEEYFIEKIKEGKDILGEEINLIEFAGVEKETNPDIRSLKELTIYGLKGLTAYLHHAYILGFEDQDIYDFVREALVSTLDEGSADQLTALALRCGEYGVKTMALLDKANTESYGKPEPTAVKLSVGSNPGILISGHDLKDMEQLLKQTENSGVDVYTHGEMLPANAYPAFKKYKHFIGNYGGSWWKQKEEFEKFNGPILMTTNCLVPPKESYKDKVFVTGVVGFDGLKRISKKDSEENKDFSEIINFAKECKSPEQLEEGEVMTGFAHDAILSVADKIVDAVKSGAIKRFMVMAGCDGRHKERDYYTDFANALPKDTVILTAGCAKYRYNKLNLGDIGGIPRVIDAGQCNDSYSLVVVALKLAEVFGVKDVNELPISYNIAWYEQKAVLVLLSLLHLGVKNIKLGPKLPGFISENVLKVLIENFNVSGITTVEEDMKSLMS